MTMNQIRFVKADAVDDARHIEEVAVFDEDGTPLDPPTSGANNYVLPAANTTTIGGVKQAAHVDGTSGTVQQIVDSLVAAGIMAAE